MHADMPLSPSNLLWARGPLGPDGDQILWRALLQFGCLEEVDNGLRPKALANFLSQLWDAECDDLALVWTLPAELRVEGVQHDGYLQCARQLTGTARRRLVLISPYLEETGIGHLQISLLDALARGVELVVVGHELRNLASMGAAALEDLRRESSGLDGRLVVYTGRNDVNVLLHSKAVIADQAQLLVGSANLTGKGLSTNLEAGALLGAQAALEAERVLAALIEQNFVHEIFSNRH